MAHFRARVVHLKSFLPIYEDFILLWRDVLLGFFTYDRNKLKRFYVINLIILLAKVHIHKCKFTNEKTNVLTLQKDIELYFKTVKYSTNKKAVRIVSVFSLKVLV